MLMNVLIVDDEPKLREGLRTFIDWEGLGYRVVDTAANGNEALEKYAEHRPDLVIADIRMPGMDGLQLISRLREMDPTLHILILSGYADFEYAKKAIAHRADGYLLKPVDEEELIEYLHEIKKVIKEEWAAEQWEHVTLDWSREALVHSLLIEQPEQEFQFLQKIAMELELNWRSYQVLLVALHSEHWSDALLQRIRQALLENFEIVGRGCVFQQYDQVGVLLKEPLLSVEREEVYALIEHALGETDVEFTVAVGAQVYDLDQIKNSYAKARGLIDRHFFLDDGKLLCEEYMHSERFGNVSEVIPSETLTDQIYYTVDVGNVEAMNSLVRKTGVSLVAEGLSEGEIKRRFVEILTSVMSKGLKKQPELERRSREYSDLLAEIFEVRTLHALYEKTVSFLEQMMTHVIVSGKHREVKMMLDIIERNYADNLKLETLSSMLNYNSAYLGKLFKNETGEYFNTYLDKVRIEKAKHYLEEGLKVYQVAEKVGYTNVDYFHAKFKKYTGTSPSAYRKLVSNA